LRGERVKLGPVLPVSEPGAEGRRAGGPRSDDASALVPGELRVERHRVLVGTATDPVALGEVRAAGKRAMAAVEWARGVRVGVGERLG
jgi:methionyl-tRNA formyltransferase